MVRCVAFSAACLLVSVGAHAQSIAPAPDSPLIVAAPPLLADVVVLKAGRVVVIQTLIPLSSLTSKSGERFPFELASPIVENGRTLVPAGLKGEGEVVHAAKAGWGGKAGEMIVNARFLDCGGVRLPIGRMKWSAAGLDKRGDAMVAAMVFTPAMFLVSGGNIDIPAGAHGDAKLAADVTIRSGAAPECAIATAPVAAAVVAAAPVTSAVPPSTEEKTR